MQFNPSPKVRVYLYALTALATPIVGYLFAKDIIGKLEVSLWSAEVSIVSVMAGFNVSKS